MRVIYSEKNTRKKDSDLFGEVNTCDNHKEINIAKAINIIDKSISPTN